MPLRFLIGRAGSGKTRACLNEIAERVRHDPAPSAGTLLWLLPEQATAQAEAALLARPGLEAVARARVLSFKRLAETVLRETGGAPLDPLGEQGRHMLLRALLARHRDELLVFGASAREAGLIAQVAGALAELARFRVSPDDLDAQRATLESAGQGASLLARKLHDLALLGRNFEEETGRRFGNPDGLLDQLARRLPQWELLTGAEVWLDGFSSFMPQEMRVIEAFLERAQQVHVTLLLDPDGLDALDGLAAARESRTGVSPVSFPLGPNIPATGETPVLLSGAVGQSDAMALFNQTEDTYLRLRALALDRNVRIDAVERLPSGAEGTRFAKTPALAALEAVIVRSAFIGHNGPHASGTPPAPALPDDLPAITVLEAPDRHAEVEAVAQAIAGLVRREGMRYRDIAVVARDLAPYEALLRATLARHRVPHFLDFRRPVTHHPLVELLRSALRIVTGGWSHDDVVHYLKTDFVPATRHDVDRLENVSLEHGWQGRRVWMEAPLPNEGRREADAGALDAVRREALAPVARLHDALSGAGADAERNIPVAAFVRALVDLMAALRCGETVSGWVAAAREGGTAAPRDDAARLLEQADEDEQAWRGVTGLLLEMARTLEGEALPLAELSQVLETGLESLTLALVPPSLDQVLVGTVERSRQPPLRAVFAIGWNDRLFPLVPAEGAVLSDTDRQWLREQGGLELAPTATLRLFRERYLGYVALTRAAERLCVSYARRDEAGSDLHPSAFLAPLLAAGGDAVLRVRLATPPRPVAARGKAAPPEFETTVHVTTGAAADVFSVSQIESHAACPFQYFSKYSLRLHERKRFELRPADVGTFHHDLLREVVRILTERKGQPRPTGLPDCLPERALDWGNVSDDDAAKALDEALLLLEHPHAGKDAAGAARSEFLKQRTRRFAQRALRTFVAQGHADRFVQAGAELAFGFPGPGLPRAALDKRDGDAAPSAWLRGRIDRLDVAPMGPGHWAVRIVDYKTSGRKLDVALALEAIDVQLPLYLASVVDLSPATLRPAAALFLPLQVPVQLVDSPSATDANGPAAEGGKGQPGSESPLDLPIRASGMIDAAALGLFGTLEPGSKSPFVNVAMKKDGTPGKVGDWEAAGRLAALCEAARGAAAGQTRAIRSGAFAVAPYRLVSNRRTPCEFCVFGDMCRVDDIPFPWRRIAVGKREDLLADLMAGAG